MNSKIFGNSPGANAKNRLLKATKSGLTAFWLTALMTLPASGQFLRNWTGADSAN
jgi:hypothetical protein